MVVSTVGILAAIASVHLISACYSGAQRIRGLIEVSTLVAPSLRLARYLQSSHSVVSNIELEALICVGGARRL